MRKYQVYNLDIIGSFISWHHVYDVHLDKIVIRKSDYSDVNVTGSLLATRPKVVGILTNNIISRDYVWVYYGYCAI